MDRMYESWAVVGGVAPIDANNTTKLTEAIDMSKWSELLLICYIGVIDAGGSATVTLTQSDASGGTYTAITGKTQAITATSDNLVFLMALGEEEMTAGQRYVKASYAASAHGQIISMVVLGRAKERPATKNDSAIVSAIVD